jgi:predicted ATPase
MTQAALEPIVRRTRGYCIEHYGVGEAYLPVLEALGQLGRELESQRFVSSLHQHAPLWLAQLASLLSPVEREQLQRELQETTRERMLREMASWLNGFTEETLLILVLEDLHWSDASTIELLAFVARQQTRARLFVLGSYRPEEVSAHRHPLRALLQELQAHKQCHELRLEGLSEAAVEAYLTTRFPLNALPTRFAHVLHRQTEGNPLFLTNLVDELVAQGVLATLEEGVWTLEEGFQQVTARVPWSIRVLIEKQIERMEARTRQVLATASLVGAVFAAEVVAVAADLNVAEVETQCEELARREQFLRRAGIEQWPDGTITARYGFRHALYQQLWHEQVTVAERPRLHRHIGERLEVAYGERAGDLAATLAGHFEQGRDYQRAVQYRQQAAANALSRHAPQEALRHFTTANELLSRLPHTSGCTRQELRLQLALGGLLMTVKGYAALEVEQTYNRARILCASVGSPPQDLFPSLWGLFAFHLIRAELDVAHTLGGQLCMLASELSDPAAEIGAHVALGVVEHHRGNFVRACEHLARGTDVLPSCSAAPDLVHFGQDPWITGLCYEAFALAPLGYLDQAQRLPEALLGRAQMLADPFSLAFCYEFSCFIARWRGESHLVAVHAENLLTLSTEHGFRMRVATGHICRGWAVAEQQRDPEGVVEIRKALAAYNATGAALIQPFFLSFLVEAASRGQRLKEGITAIDEALEQMQRTGERFYEAEIYRLKGELTLQQFQVSGSKPQVRKRQKTEVADPQSLISDPQAEAEACFHKASEIARHQQAKSLELRSIMSLARLWQQQGKNREAHEMLAEIYSWFTEGFDTADLKEAKGLLEELSR